VSLVLQELCHQNGEVIATRHKKEINIFCSALIFKNFGFAEVYLALGNKKKNSFPFVFPSFFSNFAAENEVKPCRKASAARELEDKNQ
jgi:hypothetical protein